MTASSQQSRRKLRHDEGRDTFSDEGRPHAAGGTARIVARAHLAPYLVANFGVSDDPANWGVVGWSSGGTCALNMTVKYPDLFSTFINIDGDLAPKAGTKAQTIERLFGGDATAYADWEPATVIARHGPCDGVAGWFAVSEPPAGMAVHRLRGGAAERKARLALRRKGFRGIAALARRADRHP